MRHNPSTDTPVISDHTPAPRPRLPSRARALRTLAVSLALWALPFVALVLWRAGPACTPRVPLLHPSGAGDLGGAYAVLAY